MSGLHDRMIALMETGYRAIDAKIAISRELRREYTVTMNAIDETERLVKDALIRLRDSLTETHERDIEELAAALAAEEASDRKEAA